MTKVPLSFPNLIPSWVPRSPPSSPFKYDALTLLLFPFLLPSTPSGSTIKNRFMSVLSPLPTMMSCVEPVQYQFTPDEIHELLSQFQADSPLDSTSGSEVMNRSVYSLEERKRRRMLSNRESARRSRQRKKRHMEKLNDQLNRLKKENRELKSRLCLLGQQSHYVFAETNLLRSEYMDLQIKLSGLSQILISCHAYMQLQ